MSWQPLDVPDDAFEDQSPVNEEFTVGEAFVQVIYTGLFFSGLILAGWVALAL